MLKIKIWNFIKKEFVLCVSLFLALVSMTFIKPDKNYISYIDFHTLTILLSLMLIMAGLRSIGIFSKIGSWILKKTSDVRSISLILVLLSFGFSMLITNDVALITFVPFTIDLLLMASLEKYMIPLIVLETIAANLGSMLTPIGNPQNLYLFSLSKMSLSQFISFMLPYTLISLIGLVAACILLVDNKSVSVKIPAYPPLTATDKKKAVLYFLLFLLALGSVIHIVPVYTAGIIIILAVLMLDYKMLREADYSLLLTFVFLFVFIGNMKRIPAINQWLQQAVHGNELLASILSSQVISNVPAAILLSGFTDNLQMLIVGTNLGGLGTIIASMASLISFKYYEATENKQTMAYLGAFTILNLLFLAFLLLFHFIIA